MRPGCGKVSRGPYGQPSASSMSAELTYMSIPVKTELGLLCLRDIPQLLHVRVLSREPDVICLHYHGCPTGWRC